VGRHGRRPGRPRPRGQDGRADRARGHRCAHRAAAQGLRRHDALLRPASPQPRRGGRPRRPLRPARRPGGPLGRRLRGPAPAAGQPGVVRPRAAGRDEVRFVLVNTARGAIVDTDALVEAVESGHLAGYPGDTWYPQPAPADRPTCPATR
jgi:hypothetical protein